MIKPLRVDLGLPTAVAVPGQVLSVRPYACLVCGVVHLTAHVWVARRLAYGVGVGWPDRDLLWLAPPCGQGYTYERLERYESWIMCSTFVPQMPVKLRREVWDRVMR